MLRNKIIRTEPNVLSLFGKRIARHLSFSILISMVVYHSANQTEQFFLLWQVVEMFLVSNIKFTSIPSLNTFILGNMIKIPADHNINLLVKLYSY